MHPRGLDIELDSEETKVAVVLLPDACVLVLEVLLVRDLLLLKLLINATPSHRETTMGSTEQTRDKTRE